MSKKIALFILTLVIFFMFLETFSGAFFFLKEIGASFRISTQKGNLESSKVRDRKVESLTSDYLRGLFVPNQVRKAAGGGTVNIDAYGFRKCPGTEYGGSGRVIACVGDSVTFGWSSSSDSKTYPSLMGNMLERFDVAVINAGMPRWNSMDLLDLYVAEITPLKPDFVVIMTGWNDLAFQMAGRPENTEGHSTTLAGVFSDTLNTGRLLKRIWSKLPMREKGMMKEAEMRNGDIDWDSFDTYENILNSFVILCRANSSVPVLVTLPNFLKEDLTVDEKRTMLPHIKAWTDLSYRDWYLMVREANRRIRKVAKERAVPIVECEGRFSAEYFTDVAHLNDDGNRVLASSVAETIGPLMDGEK